MQTDDRYIESLVEAISNMFDRAKEEDRPPAFTSFPNSGWEMFSIGAITFAYRHSETRDAVNKVTTKVFERRNWTRKWSDGYIRSAFAKALSELGDLSSQQIEAALRRMVQTLDEAPKALKVVFAVGGVSLTDGEIRIGSTTLYKMNDQRRERLYAAFNGILDTVKASDEAKAYYRQQTKEFLEAFGELTVAEVPAVGDPDRAREDAAQVSEPVFDFLQLIAAIEERSEWKIRIIPGGGLMARQPPRFVISDDQTEAHWDQKFAFGHRLELTQVRVEKVINLGLQSVVDAIAKGRDRAEFDDMLLNAMHWIADAERQEQIENKITSYMTAMDLFFTAEDGPVIRDLSEAVAFLLGKTLDRRKHVRKLVSRLYGLRSKVSHEGRRSALHEDVIELKTIAINVLILMSRMADRLEGKAHVQQLFADLRLSAKFDPLDHRID